jgi:diamine N-acetyltransferase
MKTVPEAIHIRAASDRDAASLAATAEAMFREAFAATNDPRQMDAYCKGHYSEAIQAEEIARPDMRVLLVQQGDAIIAFAQLELRGPSAQLHRFYVGRDWHGKGIAQQLMRRCLQMARESRTDRIALSVWVENPRAIAFYRKFGFEITGEQPFVLGTEVQTDYVMSRSLG